MGRFINEDSYEGQIDNPLTLNLYTYCANNPLIYCDPSGNDAILINETDAVGIDGHMSSLVQDENDDWYFFYWGPVVSLEKIEDPNALNSLDSLNEYLISKGLLSEGKAYNTSVYIKGDFTASYDYYKMLLDTWDSSYSEIIDTPIGTVNMHNKNYNLLTNNCTQETMMGIYLGILPDGTNVSDYAALYHGYWIAPSPNGNIEVMQKIFYNKNFTLQEFNNTMKKLYKSYTKNWFTKWWYSSQIHDIKKIR